MHISMLTRRGTGDTPCIYGAFDFSENFGQNPHRQALKFGHI